MAEVLLLLRQHLQAKRSLLPGSSETQYVLTHQCVQVTPPKQLLIGAEEEVNVPELSGAGPSYVVFKTTTTLVNSTKRQYCRLIYHEKSRNLMSFSEPCILFSFLFLCLNSQELVWSTSVPQCAGEMNVLFQLPLISMVLQPWAANLTRRYLFFFKEVLSEFGSAFCNCLYCSNKSLGAVHDCKHKCW